MIQGFVFVYSNLAEVDCCRGFHNVQTTFLNEK